MTSLRELRADYKLMQSEAAAILGIPVRTYRRYESDDNYGSDLKRRMFAMILKDRFGIGEDKGLLTIDQIKEKVQSLFDGEYAGQIDYCYLFGSYAKGTANESSDVDLYVSSSLTGLRFVGLIERLRQILCKRVDVIRNSELDGNMDLVNEIMKGGIKIYG